MSTPTTSDRTAAAAADHPSGGSGGAPLERVTVNLSSRSVTALEHVTALTGDSKTDAINKALQIYSYVRQILQDNGRVYVRDAAGETERLHIF